MSRAPTGRNPGRGGVRGFQGNEHEDREPAKLADGSAIPHAICPDGYITPRMVQNGLRQIQKKVQAGQGTKAGGDGSVARQFFEFLDG